MMDTARAILIVEDRPDDALMLEMTLQQTGIANPLRLVETADEAIAYLTRAFPFDNETRYPPVGIVLLDLKLPGMDGFEFLEWLKAHTDLGHLLVFAISGLDDLPSIRRTYTCGANSFLAKPCRAPDLENLIQWFPDYWLRTAPSYSYSHP